MAINRVNLEDVISDAKAALEAGNPERAIALCHHIFNFYPRCLEATRMLGEAYTEQRLFNEAEQLFIFVLSADPQDVLGYVDRGFIAYEQNHLDDAILYCERALELDPSIEQLREELLRLYRERQPGARAQIRMSKVGLANGRLRDGLYGQAIEEYTTVLRQTPNRLDVQVSLMEAYWRNRDYNRAEQLAQDLIQNNPFLVKANLVLWHIYGVRRNQEHASDYLERAHALDPLNLLAERLFEDSAASNDAMNYISMLGVPSIPAPDLESLNAQVANRKGLVPEWATGGPETDVVLGLKDDLPSVSEIEQPPAGPAAGFDLFALLSDTEKHVAEGGNPDEGLYPETEEDAPAATAAPSAPTQKAPSPEATEGAAHEESDPFQLYEEVAHPADTPFVPAVNPVPASAPVTSGAFDLDLSFAKDSDLSLFEEVEPPTSSEDAPAKAPEPFSLDPDIALSDEASGGFTFPPTGSGTPGLPGSNIAPFTFDEDVSPPEFMQDIPPFFTDNEPPGAAPGAINREAQKEDFAMPPLEPFSFDEDAEPEATGGSSKPEERVIKPAFYFQDLYSTDNPIAQPTEQFKFDAFEIPSALSGDEITAPGSSNDNLEPVEPAEAPGLPPEPAPEPHPIPVLSTTPETAAAPASDQPAVEPPGLPETQPGAEPDAPLPVFEGAPAASVSTGAATPADKPIEVYREPYAFYKRDETGPVPDFVLEQMAQESSLPAFSGLEELDTDAATESTGTASPASPPTLQENSPMPIRRGNENVNDLFDWEREELPDYLQPFAVDEDEVEQANLGPESPFIADVNTPPARIRSREDTGPTNLGDLPAWLVNDAAPPSEAAPATEPPNQSLPSWLTPPPAEVAPEPSAGTPAFDDSDFGDLAPFNLDDSNDFGAPTPSAPLVTPPPAPPASAGFSPAAPAPADLSGELEPFRLDDDLDDFELDTPPTPPAPLPDVSGEARRASGEVAPPPAPTPTFDLGLDMDDLKPFSFEEFEAAVPPPPPTPPVAPPVAPGAPSAFAADEDFDDLLPFNFEDDGTQTIPPPLAPPPRMSSPVPEANQMPFADLLRQSAPPAPATPVEPGLEEIRPFSLADFEDLPVPPPSRPAAPTPSTDFDFEPFTWNAEGNKLFGDNDSAGFNPFEPLSQADFAQTAPPPPAAEPDEAKPLREFGWSRQPSTGPEQETGGREPSLFEKLVARRNQAGNLPAQPGPVEINEEDLLPAEELEAHADRQQATPPAPLGKTPIELLDAAVASENLPASLEPAGTADLPDLPGPAYAEAPDLEPQAAVEAAPALAPEPVPAPVQVQPEAAILAPEPVQEPVKEPVRTAEVATPASEPEPILVPAPAPAQPEAAAPAPVAQSAPAQIAPATPTQDNLQKAAQSFDRQDYTQSLSFFNQAVKTADKAELPGIISKLKEVTGSVDANPRFHRVLGDAYKKQGQFQAALAEYSKALAGAGAKK
jgi:tetratricopeptide (TPR) repeat protein